MILIEALWFFLPALVANQCPGLAANLNLPGNTPVSERQLGRNKTWAAYYVAMVGSFVTIALQKQFTEFNASVGLVDYNHRSVWALGLLFGLGAVAGDHGKSFFKRRVGIPPGERWWPFDQLDFVFGGLIFALPLVGWIGWRRIAVITVATLLVHPIGNRIGYFLGLRKVPW